MQVKIINLDSRPDRMEEILAELPKLGITEYERFSAIKGGALGCDKSHKECLKGEGTLLILEDDCVFDEGANEIFSRAVMQLPHDYDMFYLGANVKSPAVKFSDNLYRVTEGVHTTHAILWSDKGRKKMNEIWECGMQGTIDHYLATEGLKKLNAYVCYPMIAFQGDSYSDVRLQWFDYRAEILLNQKLNMR